MFFINLISLIQCFKLQTERKIWIIIYHNVHKINVKYTMYNVQVFNCTDSVHTKIVCSGVTVHTRSLRWHLYNQLWPLISLPMMLLHKVSFISSKQCIIRLSGEAFRVALRSEKRCVAPVSVWVCARCCLVVPHLTRCHRSARVLLTSSDQRWSHMQTLT